MPEDKDLKFPPKIYFSQSGMIRTLESWGPGATNPKTLEIVKNAAPYKAL